MFQWSFGSAEKSEKLILLLNCESRVDLECPENTVFKNLFSLRMFNGAGCEDVCTNLFETSSAWQVFKVWVFQVSLRKIPVGRESLEVKKIIKVKFLWITAAAAGHFY